MSRLLDRLVEKSGGWEAFLYNTLKDVVGTVGLGGSSVVIESIAEAQEILEAYEALDRQPEQARKVPVVIDDQSTKEVRTKPAAVCVVTKTQKIESVVDAEDVEWKLEDLVLSPPPRPIPNPRREVGRIFVDKDLGGSSGELPMPANHKLVNRQALTITTQDGMALGGASAKFGEEGQIKSQHVTGHISVTGRYRLVFQDTQLGGVLIHYDVVAVPSKMTSKQYKAVVAGVNKLSVDQLAERLEHFGLGFEKCICGKEDCFGWRVIDQAEAVVPPSAATKSPTEIQKGLQQGLEKEALRAESLGVAERDLSAQDGMV